MKVTKPRLSSNKATNKTVRARTAELSGHCNFASKGASSTQLQDEVKVTTENASYFWWSFKRVDSRWK